MNDPMRHTRGWRRRERSRAPRASRPPDKGFTLIELLVVVSLIVLLIAMLVPALGKARFYARNTACMSNQRQMSVGVVAYGQDNGGKLFPIDHTPGLYWFSMLEATWGDSPGLLLCPEANAPSFGRGNNHLAWGPGGGFMNGETGSYGMNLWLLPDGAFSSDGNMQQDGYYRHVRQDGASNIPVFGDSHWVGAWPDTNDLWPPELVNGWSAHSKGYFMGRFCLDRHDFAINVAFLDGNARTVKLPDLWKLMWHRKFVPGNPVGYNPALYPN